MLHLLSKFCYLIAGDEDNGDDDGNIDDGDGCCGIVGDGDVDDENDGDDLIMRVFTYKKRQNDLDGVIGDHAEDDVFR